MLMDLILMLLFWGLIIGPCLLAMSTGLHRNEEYVEKRILT